MKLPALFVALIVFALFTQTAFSQRYLPHVVMHDMAQRLYPVEAARVMAWMVNQKAAKTTEVRGKMASKQDGGGEWTLTWHSAGGEEMARSVVSYDAASLDGGAAHFRQGWKQMAAGFAFKVSTKPEKADAVSKAFWDGFSSADLSRMTAVMSLEKWSGRTQAPENAAQAAEMAGRLARVARPVLAGACTLDHVCLARGMQNAAKDSPSYSARDLEKHAIHEFCQPGHGKAAEVIRAYAERYRGAGSATAWLGEMLPVFDALKQAGHPKHEEAWQVLLQGDAHPHFQFLLLREAGISDAECAKRLQKASTSLASRAQGAYWRHMPEEFIQIQKEPSSGTQGKIHAMSRALLPLMEAELLKKPLVESLPDLKPAEEPRLEVMVQKLLQK